MLKSFRNWLLSFVGKVWCDRCHTAVEGFLPDEGGMSAGVYVGWAPQMNPGEWIICDRCMWQDHRYIGVYGRHLP